MPAGGSPTKTKSNDGRSLGPAFRFFVAGRLRARLGDGSSTVGGDAERWQGKALAIFRVVIPIQYLNNPTISRNISLCHSYSCDT
jgi:hypothetical protein